MNNKISLLVLIVSASPVVAVAGDSYLGGNAVLNQLTRVGVKSSSANSVTFEAVANANVGVLDWTKFNVGVNQAMNFKGPGTTFFNLVDAGSGKSQIDGIIGGNGNVWVINPAGIAFGAGASVNVEGVFAAAAGTVGNAAALRAGSADLPEFDAFGGNVTVTEGSFVADQLAFLGKTVAAGGNADFSGAAKVDVGGGDKLLVDDIGGGMVSISIDDFAAKAEDVVDISGLDAGEAIVDVVANGNANVSDTTAGRLSVIAANDVVLDGDIATTLGGFSAGSMNLGDVTAKGAIESVGDVALVADGGSVTLGEAASAAGWNLVVSASGTVRTEGALIAERSADVTSGDGMTVGDVIAKGGDVRLSTAGGDVVIDGTVSSEAANGTVWVKAATDASERGSIVVNGQLTAPETGGRVIGIAGYGKLKAAGKITVDDETDANSTSRPLVRNGLLSETEPSVVQINNRADVMAKRLIILEGESGVHSEGTIDIRDVEAELQVFGHEGDIDLYENDTGVVLAYKVTFVTKGDIHVDNPENLITEVSEAISEDHGEIKIETGNGEEVVIGGGVQGDAIHIVHRKGRIVIRGDVEAPDHVILETEDGDIIVAEGGSVTVTGEGTVIALRAGSIGNGSIEVKGDLTADTVTLSAKDRVEIDPGVRVTAQDGNLTVVSDGSVEVGERAALAANGDVTISSGGPVKTGAGATLTARGGDVAIVSGEDVDLGGPVVARGGVVDISANGDISLGDVSSDAVREETALSGERQLVSVRVVSDDGRVTVREDGTVQSTHREGPVLIKSESRSAKRGGVTVEGVVAARGEEGYAQIDSSAGAVQVKGTVVSEGEAFVMSDEGDITIRGRVSGGTDTLVESRKSGDVKVDGEVESGDTAFVVAKNGDVTVNGRVRTRGVGEINGVMVSADTGTVTVNGEVAAEGSDGLAIVESNVRGDVVFGAHGLARGAAGVVLKTGNGDVIQKSGNATRAKKGYAPAVSLPAAVSGKDIVMDVNGSVTSDRGGYFAVDGKVFGKATGDMRIAAANGADMEGGERPTDARAYELAGVDFSDMGDSQSLISKGNISAYTAGLLRSYGLFSADGGLDISARKFGDLSYLRADGKLSVNNVGKSSGTRIAYFEGIEPRIDNQANDILVFLNGRLAGGNLKMISKMGAMEAFPVSTPELKSEQGIFGNPVFLHGDLDVAEPMAVGCVDYLIQEVPRLLLSGDFPLGVDRNVQASGLNPKDIYRFGRRSVAERKAREEEDRNRPTEEGDEAKRKKGENSENGDGKVAMR